MSLLPQRIALIGGTGFVGQHLAEQLVGRERQLTLLTRRRERSKALAMLPGVRLLEGGPAALDSLLAGQDAAVHMVGILHGSRRDFERAHVQLTEQVIAACQRQGSGGWCWSARWVPGAMRRRTTSKPRRWPKKN